MPLSSETSRRRRDQPVTRGRDVGEQFHGLRGDDVHGLRIGVVPAAADRRIVQERDLVAAMRRVDGGCKAGLIGIRPPIDKTAGPARRRRRKADWHSRTAVAARTPCRRASARTPKSTPPTFRSLRMLSVPGEGNRHSRIPRMRDRGHAVFQRSREIGRAVPRQLPVVFFLQVDHHQKAGVRCADIGSQINDGAHLNHPALAERDAPLFADISRMPGTSQRPSGRMMT